MNIIRVRSIAAIFILVLMSSCVGYSSPYGHSMPMGNGYGVRQVPYGNYGYRNYQQYQPNRGYGEYREREHEHDRGDRGYGQYRRHHDDD